MKAHDPLVIHYVRDMNRAIAFYQAVFDVETLSISPGWSELDFGSIKLALHILGSDMDEGPIPHAGICFLVDSIEEMKERIEAHGGSITTPLEPNEFVPVRVASAKDCEGNGFDLRQFP